MSRRLVDGNLPARSPNSNKGRTPELTEEHIDIMCRVIKAGVHPYSAIAYAGFDETNLKKWLKKGRRSKKSIYGVLFEKFNQAIAECEVRDFLVIERAAQGKEGKIEEKIKYETDAKGRQVKIIERTIVNDIKPDWRAAQWRADRRDRLRYGLGSNGSGSYEDPLQDEKKDDLIDVTPKEKKKVVERAKILSEKLALLEELED